MYKTYLKRILDMLLALILIPFVLPVIFVFGLLIKLEDRGPVFYLGKRLGKEKKVFKMYKLRSMKVNAPDIRNKDGGTFNSKDDPRLTKIGKFIRKTSIDELPQLVNVLLGDMSFIGPRPDLQDAVDIYKEDESRRLEVLPGVSGYSQAYYRNSIELKERFKHDIYYVDHISFILDTKIFLRTIQTVLLCRGIYCNKTKEGAKEQGEEIYIENH